MNKLVLEFVWIRKLYISATLPHFIVSTNLIKCFREYPKVSHKVLLFFLNLRISLHNIKHLYSIMSFRSNERIFSINLNTNVSKNELKSASMIDRALWFKSLDASVHDNVGHLIGLDPWILWRNILTIIQYLQISRNSSRFRIVSKSSKIGVATTQIYAVQVK